MNPSPAFELPLTLLRERIAGSALLPRAYYRYRPLLADGLRFFLERLAPARLHRLFAEQLGLPPSASTAQRVETLLHHVPALHKLGQVVAHDRRLTAGFRKRLQQLESFEPRTPLAEVVQSLDTELKQWRKWGIELGPQPLAEGSVAVVMPFVWTKHNAPAPIRRRFSDADGPDRPGQPGHAGVFKLLKPGIKALLEEDLRILGSLGDFLDEDCARYHLPQVDYRETFETIRELLLHEVRLDEEQQHLAEAAEFYEPMRSVVIPALLPFCTPRLTAMERIEGRKLTNGHSRLDASSRRALGRTAAEALIAHPMFSPRPAALFHADPHAGNLLLTPDNRVGILDWSLAGRLRQPERIALVQLLLGAVAFDVEQMARAIHTLAQKEPSWETLRGILHASLRELRWGAFPGIAWLTELLDRLVTRAGVRLGGDLLLFRKTLLTLEGVLADLTGQDEAAQRALLDEAVLAIFLQHWIGEWPERLCLPLDARSATTHLAATDLFSLLWSSPATLTRWWSQSALDLLQAASRVMISSTRFSLRGVAEEKAR